MSDSPEHKDDILEELDKSGNPIRRARLPKRMQLAYKIAEALDATDWKHKELTERLGKKYQSQITRWLKGDHNFTVNTLSDIEEILGIQLLNIEKETAVESKGAVNFHAEIEGSSDYKGFADIQGMSYLDFIGGRSVQIAPDEQKSKQQHAA